MMILIFDFYNNGIYHSLFYLNFKRGYNMHLVNKKNKYDLLMILWERKIFYIIGFIFCLLILLLCKWLGSNIKNSDFIVFPFSLSFMFGFLIYLNVKKPKGYKNRTILLEKDGRTHFLLSFGSMFTLGLIYKLINYILK